MNQCRIGYADKDYSFLNEWLYMHNGDTIMLVCGKSFDRLPISRFLYNYADKHEVKIVRFSDFTSNPDYSSVESGVKVYNDNRCNAFIAVGGGSTMDVAKCIKLFHNMDQTKCYLEQKLSESSDDLLAVPTTAGTGSEATKYAVIYYKGEKQSITHQCIIPDEIMFDHSVLNSLNYYHRKASMLDALCHAVESYWSVNSTEESMQYSDKAIRMIFQYKDSYLNNNDEGNEKMLYAAYLAGKAINITQTTAGHAMCYKITSTYGIAHGYAAAVCCKYLWQYMLDHLDKCIDHRGKSHLSSVFDKLAESSGCIDRYEAYIHFSELVGSLFEGGDFNLNDIDKLTDSVNSARLKNHPVSLEHADIKMLYENIFINERIKTS